MIKTFRGLLADGGQDRIRLQTIRGKVGYKIVKLALISKTPATTTQETVYKIYKKDGQTIDANIDFTDSDLLAAGYYESNFNSTDFGGTIIIFDNEVFNQDIYVMAVDGSGNSQSVNYYLELEVIPLDDAGAEYTTLKDMRST